MSSLGGPMGSRGEHGIVVAKSGAVCRTTPPAVLPWVLRDEDGREVVHVNRWLQELVVSDYPPATIKSYAYDLLNWLRYLDAVEVPWAQATRQEVRDWVLWNKQRRNYQRTRTAEDGRPAPGSINPRTRKPYLAEQVARSYINHLLSSVSGFYEYAVEADLGPLINPVPRTRRELARAIPRSFGEPLERRRRAPYRQKVQVRTPRALDDQLFDELFGDLRNTRDKALIAVAVGAGLRSGELLSMRRGGLHADTFTVEVVPKGGTEYVRVPVPGPAFVWLARYLAQRPPGPPEEPVWMTVQGRVRPLTYWALRQVLERANSRLGANVTMHDLRHTFCMRLAQDEAMTMVELQELMRHVSLSSTNVYLRPRMEDLVAKLDEHWRRPPQPAPRPAAGYDPDHLNILFGGPI